jgi:SAM-dependent MidA family methyltransferase
MQGPSSGVTLATEGSDPNKESLLDFLLGLQAESGGHISFERFMAEALHHPRFGYYGAHIPDIGARGDFATSATLSARLGKAVANWAAAHAEERSWRRIPIIEVGAGNGMLARSVLQAIGWLRRFRTDYMIVESSSVLRDRQRNFLRHRGVRWHDSMASALAELGGRALIFSNELVDAFPCRVFEKKPGGWHELGLIFSEAEGLAEVSSGLIEGDPWFLRFDGLPMHQRVERHDSYRTWLEGWGERLKQGAVLTIDYGDRTERLYHRRPAGSLRAYRNHQRITGTGIYSCFGKQDLTADVNFDDLCTWGEALGWRTLSYRTQGDFLERWCTPGTAGEMEEADAFLSSGEGAGEAFKVLEQITG